MTRNPITSIPVACGLLAAMVTLGGACTYQRAYIAYDQHDGGLPLASAALRGEALGTVSAAESGPVWKDCTEVAEAAVWVLVDETRRLGGNAVGNIRWFPTEPLIRTERPTCRQRWGWVLVWPVLATPAFQTAEVTGTAYRLTEPELAATELYVIPDSLGDRAALVEQIIHDGGFGAR